MIRQLLTEFHHRLFRSKTNAVCPNCWGRQEWACSYQDLPIDYDKYVMNQGQIKPNFIRQFVKRRLR